MVEIKETSREFTKAEQYLMTLDANIVSMKDVPDGTSIQVDGYLTFTDTKDDGDVSELLSIITPDKKVYSAQSTTFKRSLNDIATIMDGEKFAIVKTSGVTNAGRDFINCALDVASI